MVDVAVGYEIWSDMIMGYLCLSLYGNSPSSLTFSETDPWCIHAMSAQGFFMCHLFNEICQLLRIQISKKFRSTLQSCHVASFLGEIDGMKKVSWMSIFQVQNAARLILRMRFCPNMTRCLKVRREDPVHGMLGQMLKPWTSKAQNKALSTGMFDCKHVLDGVDTKRQNK